MDKTEDERKNVKIEALAKARVRAQEVRKERALLKKQEKELKQMEQEKADEDIRKRYAELEKAKAATEEAKKKLAPPPPVEEDSSSEEEEVVKVKKKPKKKPKKKKKVRYVYEEEESSSSEEEIAPRPIPRHKPAAQSRVPNSSMCQTAPMYAPPQKPSIKTSEMYKGMFGL